MQYWLVSDCFTHSRYTKQVNLYCKGIFSFKPNRAACTKAIYKVTALLKADSLPW